MHLRAVVGSGLRPCRRASARRDAGAACQSYFPRILPTAQCHRRIGTRCVRYALRTRGRCRQTLRRRCSRAQRSRTCARGRRVRWNNRAGGCAMVAQYIAELSDAAHQHRGMRGFLPEGYPPEGHRPHEPGLPESRMPGPRTESRARVKLNEVPTKSGDVVQLVRTPACHVGGRGFEPRRPRQSTHLNFTKSEPLRISNTLVRG